MDVDPGGGASRTTDPASGSSAATDVSLREYLSMAMGYERSTVRLLFGFLLAIGAFAWAMVQRRLEILNHENARIAAVTENTVSSDTYLSDEKRRSDERDKLDAWRQEVDRDRTHGITREEFQRETKNEGRATISTATKVIGAAVATIVLALSLLAYQATRDAPAVIVPAPATTTTTEQETP